MSGPSSSEASVRAYAVELILEGEAEEALALLSRYYGVARPGLVVGLPKRHKRAYGCYDPVKRLICVRSSAEYRNPFVVLHEFYHHLRFFFGKHRGTEKGADRYALESIRYYLSIKKDVSPRD